jgi:tetratricopeptide (TPR) repeat protein
VAQTLRILYLAANPIGTQSLHLGLDAQQIQARLRAEHSIELVPRPAATYAVLEQAIQEYRPAVIHFSGHGSSKGEIVLEDPNGRPLALNTEAFDKLLSAVRGTVRLVVLDACGTQPQAEAVKRTVGCAIGMSREIGDPEAIAFAAAFYGAIGQHFSVKTAFDFGVAAVSQMQTDQQTIPQLLPCGVDPCRLVLVPDPGAPVGPEVPLRLNLGRVPIPADPEVFVGRADRVQELSDAWERGNPHIIQLVASGGIGKSTIVWHCLERWKEWGYSGLNGAPALDWSFYSQGQHAYVTHSQKFLAEAARDFGIAGAEAMQSQQEQLGQRVAKEFVRTGGLVILDGVEPLQELPEVRNGALKDPGLIGFFRYLRAAPLPDPGRRWLVVLTTRWEIPDLKGLGIKKIDLNTLDDEHGADLLAQVRVDGQGLHYTPADRFRDECKKASQEYGGHALALLLLASYLLHGHGGDLARRDRVHVLPGERKDDPYHYARRVMRSYEQMFDDARGAEAGACRRVLCLVGLFDRPAALELIAAVRKGVPLPGLTSNLTDVQFNTAVDTLRRLRLLTGKAEGPDATIDAHPLIREHFGNLLQTKYPEDHRNAHRRLYEYLRQSTDPLPDSLREMEPLLEAVVHGCKAGRHKEALDEVYLPRIMRDPERYAADTLGALVPLVSVLSHFFKPEAWDRPVEQQDEGRPGLPEPDQLLVLMDAGRYLTATRGYAADEVLRAYTKAEEIGKRIGTEKQMIEILYGLWRCHLVRASLREAVKIAEDLDQRAATRGADYRLMAKRTLAASFYFRGNFVEARKRAEEGGALAAPDKSELGVLLGEVAVTSRCYGALALALLGDTEKAKQESDEALALARTDAHPHTLALALFLDCWLRQLTGDADRVLAQSEELRSLSNDNGLALWSAGATCQHGWAQYQQGQRKEGIEEMKAGLAAWEETGARLITPFWLYHLARAHAGADPEEGVRYLDRALELVEDRGERLWEAELRRLKGELLLALSGPRAAQAGQYFTEAVARARVQNAPALIEAAERSLAAAPRPSKSVPPPAARAVPEELCDATEYQFVAGERRLVVRHAEPPAAAPDLPAAAAEYADRCQLFLDATNTTVSAPLRTARGAEAVRISAVTPDGSLRVALFRFGSGPLVELALTTVPDDSGADAEIDRLLTSARPTEAAPHTAVARAITAGSHGSDGYPVGPVTLDIPPVYTAPFVFVLATPDGNQRYTVERAPGETETVLRAGGTVPVLAREVRTAISADGRPVRFEPPAPRESSDEPSAPDAATHPTRGGSALAARGAVRDVRGTAVRVSFAGPAASAELAEQVLAALDTAR